MSVVGGPAPAGEAEHSCGLRPGGILLVSAPGSVRLDRMRARRNIWAFLNARPLVLTPTKEKSGHRHTGGSALRTPRTATRRKAS